MITVEEQWKKNASKKYTQGHYYICSAATLSLQPIMTLTKKSVPFLDMQVSIDDKGYIQTDLYTKDTAKCQWGRPCPYPKLYPTNLTGNISSVT